MSDNDRASPSGRATAVEPVPVSPLRDGIPDARPTRPLWLDHRLGFFRVEFENGPFEASFPRLLRPEEIDDLEAYIALLVKAYRRRAQAIEARRAETGTGSAHEIAVRKDAPTPENHHD